VAPHGHYWRLAAAIAAIGRGPCTVPRSKRGALGGRVRFRAGRIRGTRRCWRRSWNLGDSDHRAVAVFTPFGPCRGASRPQIALSGWVWGLRCCDVGDDPPALARCRAGAFCWSIWGASVMAKNRMVLVIIRPAKWDWPRNNRRSSVLRVLDWRFCFGRPTLQLTHWRCSSFRASPRLGHRCSPPSAECGGPDPPFAAGQSPWHAPANPRGFP